MTVHIGQLTSEIRTPAVIGPAAAPDDITPWEEQRRVAAMLGRIAEDRLRTSTGHGLD